MTERTSFWYDASGIEIIAIVSLATFTGVSVLAAFTAIMNAIA